MINALEIGKRIKEFALANFETLTEFSAEIGISLQALYPYIRGTSLPGAKILYDMKKLGCSIDWLLTGEDSNETKKLQQLKKIMEE